MKLAGKTIVVGVCGNPLAYKAIDVVAGLEQLGASVYVIMTRSATKYITPLSFKSLSENAVIISSQQDELDDAMAMVSGADLFLVYPASSVLLSKLENGIYDSVLTKTIAGATCPVWIATSIAHLTAKENLEKISLLEEKGYRFLRPIHTSILGGKRVIISIEQVLEKVTEGLAYERDMASINMLIVEYTDIDEEDPFKYLKYAAANRIGYLLAQEARHRGAVVTMIGSKKSSIRSVDGINFIEASNHENAIDSAIDAVMENDIVYKVCDPEEFADDENKLISILFKMGHGKVIVAGCSEKENLIESAKEKMSLINVDLLLDTLCSFDTKEKTQTILLSKNGEIVDLSENSRQSIAKLLLDCALKRMGVKK